MWARVCVFIAPIRPLRCDRIHNLERCRVPFEDLHKSLLAELMHPVGSCGIRHLRSAAALREQPRYLSVHGQQLEEARSAFVARLTAHLAPCAAGELDFLSRILRLKSE